MKAMGVMLVLMVVLAVTAVECRKITKRFASADVEVDTNKAVALLIPHIHSDMSVFACTAVCISAAGQVLGPAAFMASLVCPGLCDEALKELEKQAQAEHDKNNS